MKNTIEETRCQPCGRIIAAVSLSLCHMAMTGCVSGYIGDSGVASQSSTTRIQIAYEASNEIEEIEPLARRIGDGNTDRIELGFRLHGSLAKVSETTVRIQHPKGERLAFGFFPGVAAQKNTPDQVGTVMSSIWLNVLFAGLPTISGIVFEPFLHADSEKTSVFSRSALFGFHRWGTGPWTETKKSIKREVTDKADLQYFSVIVKGASGQEDTYRSDRSETYTLVVLPVPEGEDDLSVKLQVNDYHPLKKQLEPFEGGWIEVALPEKSSYETIH